MSRLRAEVRYAREVRHLATSGDLVTVCGQPTFGMGPTGAEGLPLCSECAETTAALAALAGLCDG